MSKKSKLVYCLGFKIGIDDAEINKFVNDNKWKVAKNFSKNVDLIIYDENDENTEDKIADIFFKYGKIELKKRSEFVGHLSDLPALSSQSSRQKEPGTFSISSESTPVAKKHKSFHISDIFTSGELETLEKQRGRSLDPSAKENQEPSRELSKKSFNIRSILQETALETKQINNANSCAQSPVPAINHSNSQLSVGMVKRQDKDWFIKYRPKSLNQLLDFDYSTKPVQKLSNWLQNWQKSRSASFLIPDYVTGHSFKSVLLLSSNGFCKKFIASLACLDAKLNPFFFDFDTENSTDRLKSILFLPNICLVITNITFGSSFTTFVSQLTLNSNCPSICLGTEFDSSLRSFCFDISLLKPTLKSIKSFIIQVAKAESFPIDQDQHNLLEFLIIRKNYIIEDALDFLSEYFWRFDKQPLNLKQMNSLFDNKDRNSNGKRLLPQQ